MIVGKFAKTSNEYKHIIHIKKLMQWQISWLIIQERRKILVFSC